jgi:hypothetical protein
MVMAAPANAAVRTGTVTIDPNPSGPQLGPTMVLPVIPVTVSYDDQAGTITISEGGASQYAWDPTSSALPVEAQWADLGTISLAHCAGTVGPSATEVDISWGAPVSYYNAAGASDPFSGGQLLTEEGVTGSDASVATVSADGLTVTSVWSDPTLAGRNFTCASLENGFEVETATGLPSETIDFAGYTQATQPTAPPTSKPPKFVLNRKNASARFASLIPRGAVVPRPEGAYCPEIYPGKRVYSVCFAEYRQGAQWHLLAGEVKVTNNAAVANVNRRTSWTRKWMNCSLAAAGVGAIQGTMTSNDNCGSGKPQSDPYFAAIQLAPEIRLHMPIQYIGWAFTQSAGFGSLGAYRVTRNGATYVMTNAVGDSFTYTP